MPRSVNGERLVCRREGDISRRPSRGPSTSKAHRREAEPGPHGLPRRPTEAEWQQIFKDAWRWYDEFFYDADMHGHDWKAMGDKFRAIIPFLVLAGRAQLADVADGRRTVRRAHVHRGRRHGPGRDARRRRSSPACSVPTSSPTRPPDATLGTHLRPDRVQPRPEGPLARPDIAVKEGDFLIAIDGKPVKAGDDYFKLLQTTAGKKVKVTVNARPAMEGARTYEVEPLRSGPRAALLPLARREHPRPSTATDGRVGYMHINAMGAGGVGEFDKFWRAFRYKEGIIIDVRRNSGGWTEYFLIDKLERRAGRPTTSCAAWIPFRYPGSAGNGKYVVVSNENNGSDGECLRRALQGPQAGHGRRRPVVGRARRHPESAADHRQRHGPAVEQRLLRPRGQVVGREPRRRPGHPGRQRPGFGHGRPRPAAGEGHRGHAGEGQGQSAQVRAQAGLPEEIAAVEGLFGRDCPRRGTVAL